MKAAFFDIDDTLMRKSDGLLPQSAVNALKTLRQNGIITAIITGRSAGILPKAIRGLMAETGIDILSTCNGQHIEYQGKPLIDHPLPLDDLRQIIAAAEQHGWAYLLHSGSELSISRLDKITMPAMFGVEPWYVMPERWQQVPIYQIGYFTGDTKAADAAIAPLSLSQNYTAAAWDKNGLDFIPNSGTKARALREICAALNIDPKDSIAFGDGHNDIEMLQTAGIGIAMGNAYDPVKQAADYTAADIADHGIEKALKHFGLL